MTIETLRKKTKIRIAVAALLVATPFLIYSVAASAEKFEMDYDVTLKAYSVDDDHLITENSAKCQKLQACWVTLENVFPLMDGNFSNAQISMIWKLIPSSKGQGLLDIQSRISRTLVKSAVNYVIDEKQKTEIFLRTDDGQDRVRVSIELGKHKESFIDNLFSKTRSN
ncbi:MAG: hypothetical protein KA477_00030 [Candidatus Levybacteria bacterium]|jgi:hypothetical protein|nr:hypothetical protein [Candidatus Levybacteria bacterium]